MNEKLKVLVDKLKVNEYYNEINSILFNKETIGLETNLNKIISEMFQNCRKYLIKISELSDNGNLETSITEYGKLEIKSKPKPNKERQFKMAETMFHKCSEKFVQADNTHQKRVAYLNKYTDYSLDKCLNERCEKVLSADKPEVIVNNCIRDCFNFDKINKKAMINLMNEEYLKYIKSIESI